MLNEFLEQVGRSIARGVVRSPEIKEASINNSPVPAPTLCLYRTLRNIDVDIFIEVIPTAGSPTVTLLRLHFSYVSYPSKFPPLSERKNQESLG